MAKTPPLANHVEQSNHFDLMSGASKGDLIAIEAFWPEDSDISWRVAYAVARARYGGVGQHEKLKGFLEGVCLTLRAMR